jgi:hypothetical protein
MFLTQKACFNSGRSGYFDQWMGTYIQNANFVYIFLTHVCKMPILYTYHLTSVYTEGNCNISIGEKCRIYSFDWRCRLSYRRLAFK